MEWKKNENKRWMINDRSNIANRRFDLSQRRYTLLFLSTHRKTKTKLCGTCVHCVCSSHWIKINDEILNSRTAEKFDRIHFQNTTCTDRITADIVCSINGSVECAQARLTWISRSLVSVRPNVQFVSDWVWNKLQLSAGFWSVITRSDLKHLWMRIFWCTCWVCRWRLDTSLKSILALAILPLFWLISFSYIPQMCLFKTACEFLFI